MARIDQLKTNVPPRTIRYFSEEFKKKKVSELEKKLTSVSEICRQYQVSRTAIYTWIYKYSLMKKKGVKMVVEAQSDTGKIKALAQHISELEQLLGQKQFEIDFLKKQMEIASDLYKVDFKKKLSGKPSVGFGNKGKNTATK